MPRVRRCAAGPGPVKAGLGPLLLFPFEPLRQGGVFLPDGFRNVMEKQRVLAAGPGVSRYRYGFAISWSRGSGGPSPPLPAPSVLDTRMFREDNQLDAKSRSLHRQFCLVLSLSLHSSSGNRWAGKAL